MINQHVRIKTPFIKLDQLLKFAEITGSGGEASYLISEGYITIEGIQEMQRGKKIKPGMSVKCSIPGKEEILIIIDTQES